MVIGDMQNKDSIGDTWSPTYSTRYFKYFLVDAVQHKEILYQLDFIGELLQAKFESRVFVDLDSRYADNFTEYSNYFGRALILLKSMYGMSHSGKLFADELT